MSNMVELKNITYFCILLFPASALEASTSVPRTTSFWQLALTAEQSTAQVGQEKKKSMKILMSLILTGKLDECSIIRKTRLQVAFLLSLTNTTRQVWSVSIMVHIKDVVNYSFLQFLKWLAGRAQRTPRARSY